MRRGESYAFQTVNLAARAQQLGEGKPVADAVAEGVHILAQQRDFLGAFVHALADFGEDVSGTAVMFLAARGRHDAEGAGVVAAYGDGHPARHLRRTVSWQLAWEVVEFLLHLHLRVAFDAGLVEQLRQGSDVLGTEHGVDPRGFFRDLLTVELRHAAADRDLQVRAFLFNSAHSPMVPYMRSAAFSRTAQVFMTIRSMSWLRYCSSVAGT